VNLPDLAPGYRWKMVPATKDYGCVGVKVKLQKRFLGLWITEDYGFVMKGEAGNNLEEKVASRAAGVYREWSKAHKDNEDRARLLGVHKSGEEL